MADNSYHILVADDERSMRELLEYLFTKEGYRVDTAESGSLSLALLTTSSSTLHPHDHASPLLQASIITLHPLQHTLR